MSGVVVLGLLWAAVGILLGLRWWSDRAQPPAHHAAREELAAEGAGPVRFGRLTESRADQRRQAMRLAYAAGTSLVAVGLFTEVPVVLALGAALVNLGTLYRHLVALLDEAPETEAEPVDLLQPAHLATS